MKFNYRYTMELTLATSKFNIHEVLNDKILKDTVDSFNKKSISAANIKRIEECFISKKLNTLHLVLYVNKKIDGDPIRYLRVFAQLLKRNLENSDDLIRRGSLLRMVSFEMEELYNIYKNEGSGEAFDFINKIDSKINYILNADAFSESFKKEMVRILNELRE